MNDFDVADLLRWIFKELTHLINKSAHDGAFIDKGYLRNSIENLEIFEGWLLCFAIMFERFEYFTERDYDVILREYWRATDLCPEIDFQSI